MAETGARLKSSGDKTSPIILSICRFDTVLDKICINLEQWSDWIKFCGSSIKSSGDKTSPISLSICRFDTILDKICITVFFDR